KFTTCALLYYFTSTPPRALYPLSLHDALPISGEHREAELLHRRHRHRDDAVLERPGGIAGIVLEIQVAEPQRFAEPVRPHQRRAPRHQVPLRNPGDGQQILIPPDGSRTGRDPVPERRGVESAEIVLDLERPEALLAHKDRLRRKPPAALAAHQPAHRHLVPPLPPDSAPEGRHAGDRSHRRLQQKSPSNSARGSSLLSTGIRSEEHTSEFQSPCNL